MSRLGDYFPTHTVNPFPPPTLPPPPNKSEKQLGFPLGNAKCSTLLLLKLRLCNFIQKDSLNKKNISLCVLVKEGGGGWEHGHRGERWKGRLSREITKQCFKERISDYKLSSLYYLYSLEPRASKWIFAYYVCPLKI